MVSPNLNLILGVPGAMGFDLMVREAFEGAEQNFSVGAVESLPSIAKREKDGITIHAIKKRLNLALSQHSDKPLTLDLEKLLGLTLKPLNNFLSLALLNPGAKVNPLLFLEAVRNLNHDARDNAYTLSQDLAQRLAEIESEVASLGHAIESQTGLDLGRIKSVRDWLIACYPLDIQDKTNAATCLKSHRIYGAMTPDFTQGLGSESDERKSRYLTEQIPYGLLAYKGLAELFNLETPAINAVIRECEPYLKEIYLEGDRLIPEKLRDTSTPQRFGMYVPSQISRVYQAKTKNSTLEKREFQENGFAFLGKILPDEILKELEAKVCEALKGAPEKDTNQSLLNLHWKDPWFLSMCSRSEFVDVACALLGEKRVKIFSSLIVSKPPHSKMWVPWHQDAAYDWPLTPVECASVWLALDDVTPNNGPMVFAKKAHLHTFPMEKTPQHEDSAYFFATQLEHSIPPHKLDRFEKIKVTMKKGECSFHHIMIPHTSAMNTTDQRRCAFIVRYCRENAYLKTYEGMPREDFFMNYKLYDVHDERQAA
ncbi:hypothetical protein EIL50_04645 [bacterium NHP-B]|nr:hypothetical protein EIL50_04645 [bacterium NHP-B]